MTIGKDVTQAGESDLNLLEPSNLVCSGFNDLQPGVPAEVLR